MKHLLSLIKILLFAVAYAMCIGHFTEIFITLISVGVITSMLVAIVPNNTRIACIDLGTVASGVGTPTAFNVQYCPQIIAWIQTAAVDINIKVLGDGTTYDVPAAGISELGVIRQQGRFTNAYVLNLTDGLLLNKTTTITVTNQVASAFTLYGWSENGGGSYLKGISQVCQAASGIDFSGFRYITFPAAGATDQFTLTFKDSTNQAMRREELRFRTQRYQNVINTAGYDLDNIGNEVQKINLIPTAQQTAYIIQKVTAKGTAADKALLSRAG